MKSGAGDDPFADDQDDADDVVDEAPAAQTAAVDERTSPDDHRGQQTTADSVSELPYKYRRESVKEGRTQQPMFLQDDTKELISETVSNIESQFDEDVYKTDVVEAMIVAGGEDTTPEAILRRWGYGMKNS